MVATSSTLAASRLASLTVMFMPLTDSMKFSLGIRVSVKLPIMTEMTAKGPGDGQGVGREPTAGTRTSLWSTGPCALGLSSVRAHRAVTLVWPTVFLVGHGKGKGGPASC